MGDDGYQEVDDRTVTMFIREWRLLLLTLAPEVRARILNGLEICLYCGCNTEPKPRGCQCENDD